MMSETAKFTEDILSNARGKAESIIREAETEAQKASEEAKLAAEREAESIMQGARADADAVKRRQISEARHRAKIREQEEKDKIMQEVLDRAKKRTLELVKDENKYSPLLARLIESGINELGEKTVMIHLNARDLKTTATLEPKIAKFASHVKVEWSKQPIDAAGGATVSSPDGKMRIVNTLEQIFDALESRLLIEASKSLFGE